MDYVTVKQLADRLFCEPETLTRYIRNGKLKATKVARKFLLTEEDIQEFLETYGERKAFNHE